MRSMLARTAAVIAFGAASFTSHGALAESVLRHVPQADLKVLDPVTNTAFITMQFAFMVYDQLFSVDENYEPHPQMVESYTDQRRQEELPLHAPAGPEIPRRFAGARGRCGGFDQALGDEGSGGRKDGRAGDEAGRGR